MGKRAGVLAVCLLSLYCEAVLLPPSDLSGADSVHVPGCSGRLLVNGPISNTSRPISITAFFPLPDPAGPPPPPTALHYLLPAAVIAAEEASRILEREGFHLQLDLRNTSCDRFLAVHELVGSVEQNKREGTPHLAVLGPGCLNVATTVSPLAHILSLPQVSYANETSVPVIAPAEKGEAYPDLFFMVRNIYHITKTALLVMDYFQWTEQVGFLYDDALVYSKTVEQLARGNGAGDFILEADTDIRITVPGSVFERLSAEEREETVREFVKEVRRNNIRVIAGVVGEESACALVCETKAGTTPGDGFAFIFVGAFQEDWWRNCLCGLKETDLESMIFVSSQVKNTLSDDEFELGGNLGRLKQDYLERLNSWCPETVGDAPNTFFATTYDSMLSLGLAINASLPLLRADSQLSPNGTETMNAYNDSIVFQALHSSLLNSNFIGASGRVTFSSVGERMGVDVIQQFQGKQLVVVGTYNSQSERLEINDSSLRWPGSGEVPGVNPAISQETAPLPILIVTLFFTVTSNILVVVLMVFVIRHRNHRILLASSQRLNYIVFAGAYIAFATIYIFVLLESDWGPKMPTGLFTFFCIVRLYLIMMGFTFTFGTLFTRAWRIYRIFNNPFVSSRKYTDTYLMMMVGVLALVDIVLVTVFVGADNYGRTVSTDDPDYATFTTCTYLGCAGQRFFVIGSFILGLYKILQMFLFIFVVSLVRRGVIERKIYDDSKWLAIALYVTAIVFIVGLPLQVLLTVSFMIAEALLVNMTWVIVSTDVTLAAIYLPKLYQIIYKKVDVRKLMQQKSKFYLYSEHSRSTIL